MNRFLFAFLKQTRGLEWPKGRNCVLCGGFVHLGTNFLVSSGLHVHELCVEIVVEPPLSTSLSGEVLDSDWAPYALRAAAEQLSIRGEKRALGQLNQWIRAYHRVVMEGVDAGLYT